LGCNNCGDGIVGNSVNYIEYCDDGDSSNENACRNN